MEVVKIRTILIVDDDINIGNMLSELLTKEGYSVRRAVTGTEALRKLRENKPDLVLLDLMLPEQSGERVLPHIKDMPVIVMSAKTAIDDKVNMLLGGAVDYVTKPFDTKELLARITVHLRGAAEKSDRITFGNISLDTVSREVTVNGTPVKLTRTEYAILHLLMENPERVVAKTAILDSISEDTPDCVESSLKVHISNLRKKLKAIDGQDYIEAVWGIGFKMRN